MPGMCDPLTGQCYCKARPMEPGWAFLALGRPQKAGLDLHSVCPAPGERAGPEV